MPVIPVDEFRTCDLAQAAFLVAKALPLLRVDHGPDRATFVFPTGAAALGACRSNRDDCEERGHAVRCRAPVATRSGRGNRGGR
jgi:hypothetical protein